jgi:hypothetical protein
MLGVVGVGKRPEMLCLVHFATDEQSSKGWSNVSDSSLARHGATRHFSSRGVGDLYHTPQGQLNLPCLRLQGFLSGWLGGAFRLKLALAAPRFWGCSLVTAEVVREHMMQENRTHQHELHC